MTVILVLSTFVVFLLIDHFFSRNRAVVVAEEHVAETAREAALPRLQPSLVGGF